MSKNNQQASARLDHWYSGCPGKMLGDVEKGLIEQVLPELFGYHIVTLGTAIGRDVMSKSPILNQHCFDSALGRSEGDVDALAEPDCLPIASDAVDVVVLPHVLEFIDHPEAVLNEVDRVLIPEGHVLVVGFNPFSLWGVWRSLGADRGRALEQARFISVSKMKDWFFSLGYEVVSIRYGFYRPPLARPSVLERLTLLEQWGERWWPICGASYVLLAKKRVSTLTLIKPRWYSRRRLVTQGVVNRASRSVS
jgi:SAM-dependent methyltransferase